MAGLTPEGHACTLADLVKLNSLELGALSGLLIEAVIDGIIDPWSVNGLRLIGRLLAAMEFCGA